MSIVINGWLRFQPLDMSRQTWLTIGMITPNQLLPHFDGNKAKLAACLGLTRQAVSLWDVDGPIPEKHELRLKFLLRPDLFDENGIKDAARSAAA